MPKRKITDLEKFTELERVVGVKAIPRTASAVKNQLNLIMNHCIWKI